MKHIITIIIFVCTIAAAGLLLVADLAPFCSPEHFLLPSILAIGFEWLLLVNVFFVVVWLLSHHKLRVIFPILAVCASFYSLSQTFTISSVKSKGEHTLTVLSYNTSRTGNFLKPAENGLLHYIKKQNADMVFLQEVETYQSSNKYLTEQELRNYFAKQYPYVYLDFLCNTNRQYGVAILSKYPLLNMHTIPFESYSNIANYCDVVVNTDTFRLFNNHLESVKLRKDDVNGESLGDDAGKVKTKLSKALPQRAKEAEIVSNIIHNSPYPVIVCGDFNDVPQSYTTRQLSKGLKDAFLESSSWSVGHTIKKKGLGARIDYILHSPTFSATDFQIDKVVFSDHYPIHCTLHY